MAATQIEAATIGGAKILRRPDLGRAPEDLSAITAGDADLLVALEKGVVEAPVGVHVALVDIVLDAAAPEVDELGFETLHIARKLLLGL